MTTPAQLTFVTAADLVAVLDRDDPDHRLMVGLWQLEFDAGTTLVSTDHALVRASLDLQRRYGHAGLVPLLEEVMPALRVECTDRADLDLAVAALLVSREGEDSLADHVDDQMRRRLRVPRSLKG